MGTDRNTIIGFVLIGALLMAMFYFNSKDQLAFEGEKKRKADSVALVMKKAEILAAKTAVKPKTS
jgi:YidC/Oxa1 family membrane protein insertase